MIIPHPKLRFDNPKAFNGIGVSQVVQCCFCQKLAVKTGRDAGEAADAARREGFRLIPGRKLSDPMKWSCGCVQ